MRALRLGMAALSAALVLGFAAGCSQGDAEALKAIDGKLGTISKRIDALEGVASPEAAKSDSAVGVAAKVRALELRIDGLTPSNAAADVAVSDEISKLKADLAALKAAGTSVASPDAAAMLKPGSADEKVNPAFLEALRAGNQVIEAEKAVATRKRMRDDSMQRFDTRMERVAKDKGLSAGEVSAVKDIYQKHYDASAALMETAWGGRWGGNTDRPEVTEEQRQAAREQLNTLRTETEASLKAAVPADAYDSVARTVTQGGGMMRGDFGGMVGDIVTTREGIAGITVPGTTAPATGEGGATATPRPRTRGGDNSGGGGTRGNRGGNGGNGNGGGN
jgi:hypothetical protein